MENKHLILRIEDFKKEFEENINNLIQKYKLPMYFIENIFSQIHNQINYLYKEEYNKLLEEEEEKNVKNKK